MDTSVEEHELGPDDRPLGFCLKCTHQLHAGGDERCPECGAPFNSRVPRSYYAFKPGWFARRLLSPPGLLWWVAFGLLSIYLMAAMSAPGGYLIAEILGGFALAVAVALYALSLACSFLAHLRYNRSWWGKRQLLWLVSPCIVLACLLAIYFQVSIHAGFWYSRGAMQAQVDIKPAEPPAERPFWLGVYPIKYDASRPNLLLVRGAGFINETGFIYLPEVRDTDYYEQGALRAWRFNGDWFLAELRF